MNLDDLRQQIDALDRDLVRLLNERTRVALEIGRAKRESGQEFYVPSRERAVLDRVAALSEGPLDGRRLQNIYREIMSATLSLEHPLRVAYFGPVATFTHQAARARFGASVEYVPCETIGGVFATVARQEADYGVVPVENSTEGAVTHTLDEFTATALRICAEVMLPIAHHLMAKDPAVPVERIYSHPQVFGQCRLWLQEHTARAELIPMASTARAAEKAASEPGAAALASDLAAEVHGLTILHRNIQDLAGNITRFLVIGRRIAEATGQDKTSILFAVPDQVGALYDALSVFRSHGLNMTRIESRPSRAKAWEYLFFVDIQGHPDQAEVKAALRDLSDRTTRVEVLGAYPRGTVPES